MLTEILVEIIGIIVFAFIIVPLILLFILLPMRKDEKAKKGVSNSDAFYKNFSFALKCTQQEATEKLAVKEKSDALNYDYYPLSNKMLIRDVKVTFEYGLTFYTVEGETYLKVSYAKMQKLTIGFHTNIQYKINTFFINKLGAVPIDYKYFQSITGSN